MTRQDQEQESKRPQGRPRPDETVERDAKVLALLQEGDMTRNQIAQRLGLKPVITYLSLSRLRDANKARLVHQRAMTGSKAIWTAQVDDPWD